MFPTAVGLGLYSTESVIAHTLISSIFSLTHLILITSHSAIHCQTNCTLPSAPPPDIAICKASGHACEMKVSGLSLARHGRRGSVLDGIKVIGGGGDGGDWRCNSPQNKKLYLSSILQGESIEWDTNSWKWRFRIGGFLGGFLNSTFEVFQGATVHRFPEAEWGWDLRHTDV